MRDTEYTECQSCGIVYDEMMQELYEILGDSSVACIDSTIDHTINNFRIRRGKVKHTRKILLAFIQEIKWRARK